MQRANKPTTPAGLAFAFISLTILPFSLSALGVRTEFSLGAAVAALRQISSVLSSAYEPLGSALQTEADSLPNPVQPCEVEAESPKMLARLGFEPDVNSLMEAVVPPTDAGLLGRSCQSERAEPEPDPEDQLEAQPEAEPEARVEAKTEVRIAARRVKAGKAHRLWARDVQAKAQLPVRSRLLDDVLELVPSNEMIEVPGFVIEVKALARARADLRRASVRQALRRVAAPQDSKDLKFWLQFDTRSAPAGKKLPCPPPPVNVRRV